MTIKALYRPVRVSSEFLARAAADEGESLYDRRVRLLREKMEADRSPDTMPAQIKPPETCTCDNGIVWLGEKTIIDEIKAAEGTGATVSFSFGFGGRESRRSPRRPPCSSCRRRCVARARIDHLTSGAPTA